MIKECINIQEKSEDLIKKRVLIKERINSEIRVFKVLNAQK